MINTDQLRQGPLSNTGLLQLFKLIHRGQAADTELAVSVTKNNHSNILEKLTSAKLAGQFYALTTDTAVLDAFPREEQETLRGAYERQYQSNRSYLELLEKLRDRLADEGVDLLLLKGLFLAQRFSGGMDRRFMWDADILVHQHQLRDAIRVAGDLGLTATGDTLPVWILNLLNLHALEVSHRGRAIDIHWRLRNRPGYHINYERIWNDAQAIVIDGQPFNALSDEDALALSILEIGGDMERGHIKLRSLWDVYQILQALDGSVNWDEFFERRKGEGLLQLAVNMLTFFLYCLDCQSECPRLVESLQQQPTKLLIDNRDVALQILERPKQHLANRALYARLQPRAVPLYWIWWLATAPLRFALTRNL